MIAVIVVAAMTMAVIASLILRHWLIRERVDGLQQSLQAARGVVVGEAAIAAGDTAGAQRRALALLARMQGGNAAPLAVFDRNGRVLLDTGAAGDRYRLQTATLTDGGSAARALVALGRDASGGDVTYGWSGAPGMQRRAVALAFRPWGWTLSAGVATGDIDARFWEAFRMFALIVALIGGAVMTAAVLIMRSIRCGLGAEPVDLAALAECVADGDWQHEAPAQLRERSAMGQLYAMRGSLERVIRDTRCGAESMARAARQIAQGNDDLSQRTQAQAASLQEQAASLEQMAANVNRNAEHATDADTLARAVRGKAEEGGAVAGEAAGAMRGIAQDSSRIADIIGLIDEIAFQTNLLALNASVESARAGEHGRGFAVVAGEVRQLAQRSASAAREIRGLIGESTRRVHEGVSLVERSEKALQGIRDDVRSLADAVAGITAAGAEQSSGLDQLQRAMGSIDDATQQNAALVEQVAAASRDMNGLAESLLTQLAYFRLGDDCGAMAAPSAPSASQRADNEAVSAFFPV